MISASLDATIRKAHKRVVQLFGSQAFSFSRDGRSKFNAAVYDAQMLSCAKVSDTRVGVLTGKKDELKKAYADLEKDHEFSKSVTLATSDKAALQGRVQKVGALLKNL